MKVSKLKVGDRIRILCPPNECVQDYGYIHKDTVRIFKKIAARKRSVRIDRIDEYGTPWYSVRFRRKDGSWEYHCLNVMTGEANWVPVKKKEK